ncbi:tRNA threonylcarbamoyladenosine dehydratase [Azonexus hydrophilus]|uniref:tRNA threonylcarbamoyladenosine dehydratase n=1 Tax=Azonexus hydrophilus TaxID=418702 RepID=UPI00040C1310|nr:tRNA threonylcarbamoyladenosine dehydratase [Azonexus hydrophilus]
MSNEDNRRFGGIARLYGSAAYQRLRAAHVCVVGIGGVGSWVAEALARTAVGRLTLIDLDMVAESNTNRQIHALEPVFGKAKVDAMAERIAQINPECVIQCIEDFVTVDNMETTLRGGFDVVVDAIDQARVKTAMIDFCKRRKQPIVVVGAAGGQIDPTQIRVSDLSQTVQDPLLAKVRASLRREHGFPRQGKFGVPAVYSTEALRYPDKGASCDVGSGPAGLNCAGFGSSVCVTSVFGMAAASHAIGLITYK